MENKPTYYTAKSGYAYSGSTWVGGKVPEDWSNIIVNPRHTLTADGDMKICDMEIMDSLKNSPMFEGLFKDGEIIEATTVKFDNKLSTTVSFTGELIDKRYMGEQYSSGTGTAIIPSTNGGVGLGVMLTMPEEIINHKCSPKINKHKKQNK